MLLLAGSSVYCLVTVVELSGSWEALSWQDRAMAIVFVLLGGLVPILLGVQTGALVFLCFRDIAYEEAAVLVVPEPERRRQEQWSRQFNLAYWRWVLGWCLVFSMVAYLDGSFLFGAFGIKGDRGIGHALFGLLGFFGAAMSFFLPSLLALAVLHVMLALVEAKWGPDKPPRIEVPAGALLPRWQRFQFGVVNFLSRLSHGPTAKFAFWLVILLAGIGLGAFELYTRLASADWPYPLDSPATADFLSTSLLALAVFYVPVSLLRLVRMARGLP
jgi:hypothetical protein